MSTLRIVVFGSLNIDHVWRVRRLPGAGETVMCSTASQVFGGKGANQAVAAARAGGQVTLVGAVGSDEAGLSYLTHLADTEQLTTACVRVDYGSSTGAAHVYVADDGENQIVVHGGANDWWTIDGVQGALVPILSGASRLVLPAEMPREAVVQALIEADRANVPVLFNASPCLPDFPWGMVRVDTVVVNEHECADLMGHDPEALIALSSDVREALLQARGVSHLVVTRGGRSTCWFSVAQVVQVPAYPVSPVDTVGAGDTFAGVLSVGLVDGLDFPDAIARANVAAALSTLAAGAQTAMPRRERIDAVFTGGHALTLQKKRNRCLE